jgi:hypothetical protein
VEGFCLLSGLMVVLCVLGFVGSLVVVVGVVWCCGCFLLGMCYVWGVFVGWCLGCCLDVVLFLCVVVWECFVFGCVFYGGWCDFGFGWYVGVFDLIEVLEGGFGG